MPDANDASHQSDSSANADDDAESTIQSLTDLFDQMDRAAFKRVLANRDARSDGYRRAKTDNR